VTPEWVLLSLSGFPSLYRPSLCLDSNSMRNARAARQSLRTVKCFPRKTTLIYLNDIKTLHSDFSPSLVLMPQFYVVFFYFNENICQCHGIFYEKLFLDKYVLRSRGRLYGVWPFINSVHFSNLQNIRYWDVYSDIKMTLTLFILTIFTMLTWLI